MFTNLYWRLGSAAVVSGVDLIVRLVTAWRRVTGHHITMVRTYITRVMVTPRWFVAWVMSSVIAQFIVRGPVPNKSVLVCYWYLGVE